ncbi:hypothetical protein ADIARSV_0613 [Arcticibacter svalbardensis MN12-7]|uniref:Uncharacterized protein n=1 Tax=Arcticibacter svalbardensis MN12-7 TaxID=1150600 RepID=R9GX42_9SPHI|nr:hypothetical protein ADIARSV_0613 [Arcticibacter svalbardensis MN12-7]
MIAIYAYNFSFFRFIKKLSFPIEIIKESIGPVNIRDSWKKRLNLPIKYNHDLA